MVKDYIQPWSGRVTFVQGDVLNEEDLQRLIEHNIDKVVHAAVFTGIHTDVEAGRSHSIVDINVMGTTNLLDLARRVSVERFLYVSSRSVYGEGRDPEEVLHEDSPLYPRTLYAVSKHISELLTRRYGELHGFETVSVRLGGPYGPMERVTGHRANQSLLKEWTGNIIRGEPIEVGDRTTKRSFTYVRDIADGICVVLDAPSLSHEVYNHESGEWIGLEEVIEALRDLHPNLEVVDVPSREAAGSGIRMDVTRLRDDLGFVPRFDLARIHRRTPMDGVRTAEGGG